MATVLVGTALYLGTRAEGVGFAGEVTLLGTLNAVISAVVGAVVIDRRGNHLVGWLFCGSGLCWSIAHLGGAAAAIVADGGSLVAQDPLIWSTTWSAYLAFAMAPTFVMYVFPTGSLFSRAWRAPFGFALLAAGLGSVGYALSPGVMEDIPLVNPYGLDGALGEAMISLREISWPLLLLSVIVGVVSLRRRMKAAPSEQRQQIKWLVLAGFVLGAFVMFWGTMDTLGNPYIAASVSGLFLPVLPIALGIAILRHRLYDIDVLINRTLVYVSLSAVLGAFYLAIVFLLQRMLNTVTADSNIAVAASTLAVAALFRPLRARIQAFINRRFYRQRYDAAAIVGGFSQRLRNEVELDSLKGELLLAVSGTMQPSRAAVWLRSRDSTG